MKSWQGGRMRVVCACMALSCLAIPVYGIAIDPNNGPFSHGDSINFNYNENQMVFDKTVGTKGALVDFDSDEGAGTITSINPNYAVAPYTMGIRWEVPLLKDTSGFMMMFGSLVSVASGEFGNESGQPELSWELVDLENAGAVLLSGTILDSQADPSYDFTVCESPVGPGVLFPAYGGADGGMIGVLINGGSLASQFTREAKMTFSCFVIPNPTNFTNSMVTPGAGSVTIWAVPEPRTACLLLGGAAVWFGRRRKSRKS